MPSESINRKLDHFEAFNLGVAVLFDFLLGQFRVGQSIPYQSLTEEMAPIIEECRVDDDQGRYKRRAGVTYVKGSNVTPKVYLDQILRWLKAEGFLHDFAEMGAAPEYQLTSKALDILNATPSGLDQPLRTKLSSAVKEAGTAAGKAAISTVVGHIIGAAARSFLGAPASMNL